MASLRDADIVSSPSGQGILRIVKIPTCVTGDTVTYKNPVSSWIAVNRTTTDAVTVTYSAVTHLFTLTVANTPDIDLMIIA
jgi:hypothetical protein